MAASPKAVPQKDERDERLAAALRENLKRRKAQARSQAGAQAGSQARSQAPAGGEGRKPIVTAKAGG